MVTAIELLFGPLAGPECRRALGRGWLILVRTLAACAALTAMAIALWVWWLEKNIDDFHQPYLEFRIGLGVVAGMVLAVALLLGPALMAGSLAGEKERGALGLLLTTRVSSREIVSGRFLGKYAQLAMTMLACLPALVFLAALAGVHGAALAVFLLMPAAVGFGGCGLAAAASVLSRRGRDALLTVYLVDIFFLLTPLASNLGLPPALFQSVESFNPFNGLTPLVEREAIGPPLATSLIWIVMGVAGIAVAAGRLRPVCLAQSDGERTARRAVRRGFVPPVDERRPMAWKELFIEKVATLGRFGKWIGLFLVVGILGISVGLTGLIIWDVYIRRDMVWDQWAREQLEIWIGGSGWILSCLIQWAIGLRAAVSISSERERGTWDALLTSPLDAHEIVVGKLYGSLYALRWLIVSAFLAWALAAVTGAVELRTALPWALNALFIGAFMAAVGVRTSLASATATKAMSLTIGIWLGAYAVVVTLSGIILLSGLLLANTGWLLAAQLGVVPPAAGFWFPLPSYIAWPLASCSLWLGFTLIVVADTRLRFDRIAGRMAEGSASTAIDSLIYGRSEVPVLLETADDAASSPAGGWVDAPADQRREDPVSPSA